MYEKPVISLSTSYLQSKFKGDGYAMLQEAAAMGFEYVELGHSTRKNLHCGICGEHGGDPSSIEFCHEIGLDYVSCSPYRVPIARLAAAQANIKHPRA